jgi:hypothetical protein
LIQHVPSAACSHRKRQQAYEGQLSHIETRVRVSRIHVRTTKQVYIWREEQCLTNGEFTDELLPPSFFVAPHFGCQRDMWRLSAIA